MSQPIVLTAAKALSAWELGESGGGFADFAALLSPRFRLFSHPDLRCGHNGVVEGPAARERMEALIRSRELHPNALRFSDVVVTTSANMAVTLFDVAGRLADGRTCSGHAAIAFVIEDGEVSGFCAYRGGRGA